MGDARNHTLSGLGGHVALGFYTVQQALVSSSLAGNRAGLTLFGMAVAGHFGYIDFPPGIQFLTTLPGIAGLFGLSVIEELTERDEDMQDILQYVNYGTKGMAGALAVWSVDMMPDGTPAWLATPLGFMLAGATHYYRMKLHESLRGLGDHWLSPRTYLVALETGGVLALLLALIFAPIIALVLIVALMAVGALYLTSRWTFERQVQRQPCSHCGKRIRKEASVCRYCTQPVPVEKWLTKKQDTDIQALGDGATPDYAAVSDASASSS